MMLVCTSGGHFTTMLGLKKFWTDHERVWVTDCKQDTLSLERIEKVFWLPYQGPRDLITFLRNLPKAFELARAHKPDLIVSTGASLAVNFAMAAKVLGIKYVFIESPSRLSDLSLSGKLVYLICSELYVQSPILANKYTKAIFAGYV